MKLWLIGGMVAMLCMSYAPQLTWAATPASEAKEESPAVTASDKKPVVLANTDWNDGLLPMVVSPWKSQPGIDWAQTFPKIDPKGYAYTKDCVAWLAFVLQPEYIPKDIEEHLLPLAKGELNSMWSGVPANAVRGVDGFVVRYHIGDYVIQVTDTRGDLQLMVRDLTQKANTPVKPAERIAFQEKLLGKLLLQRLLKYPDGRPRKTIVVQYPEYSLTNWNWFINNREHDDPAMYVTSTAMPFESFTHCLSDGQTLLLIWPKVYNAANSEVSSNPKIFSRFDVNSSFHCEVEGWQLK